MILRAAVAVAVLGQPAQAVNLAMPLPATVTYAETLPLASHPMATGASDGGHTPLQELDGAVTRQVWQLTAQDTTPLQIMAALQEQLTRAGFDVVFACETRSCGGYDFRFDIAVVPAPEMFVDLARFRYLVARQDETWTELVVSTSAGVGYVQQTVVGPPGTAPTVTLSTSEARAPALVADSDIGKTLLANGRAVLGDLAFPTGSTDLPEDSYPSLTALAAFLRQNTEVTIALVGHTDAEGGAEGNIAISRARADSARAVLVNSYGIDPARIDTYGVGFFAPMERNDTEAGRQRNRRVEVVITSTP